MNKDHARYRDGSAITHTLGSIAGCHSGRKFRRLKWGAGVYWTIEGEQFREHVAGTRRQGKADSSSIGVPRPEDVMAFDWVFIIENAGPQQKEEHGNGE